MRIILILLFMTLIISPIFGNGCSDTHLKRSNSFGSINTGIDVCTTPADTIKTKLKFLFVVDRSGSNKLDIGTDGQGNPVWNYKLAGTCPLTGPPGALPAVASQPYAQGYYCPIINPSTQAYFPTTGTDIITCPTGTSSVCNSRRFSPIYSMAQQYALDPNSSSIYWGLITFDDKATQVFPPQNSNDPLNLTTPLFSNQNLNPLATANVNRPLDNNYFQDEILIQEHSGEGGNTNYLDALDQVRNVIAKDIQQAKTTAKNTGTPPKASTYIVFFISDGAPWVHDPTGNSPFGVLQSTPSIQAQFTNLSDLETINPDYVDNIVVNTAYYYFGSKAVAPAAHDPTTTNYDARADDLLSTMSVSGGGRYLNFGAGQAVDITKFQVPVRISKYALLDLWIKDMNTVWWNGELKKDSDMDGLPDEVEIQYHSDPYKYDSDGDGVGDGVWYSQHQKPCQGLCSTPADPPPACSTATFDSVARRFPDSDNDGLNDCEEQLLGSVVSNFDSNGDKIPDYMEYIFGIAFTAKQGIDLTGNPAGDGISNYQKIKYNYPVDVDFNNIAGIQQLQLKRRVVSDNSSQTCYHYDVLNLSTATPNDTLRVMMVEGRTGVGSKPVLRVGQKSLVNGNVQFVNSDIK